MLEIECPTCGEHAPLALDDDEEFGIRGRWQVRVFANGVERSFEIAPAPEGGERT